MIRLDGYYRCGPTFVDTYLFLKLHPDGYWFWADSFEPGFDFPSLLDTTNTESLKLRFPEGQSLQDDIYKGFRYAFGRYRRVDSFRGLKDALLLTSWTADQGKFHWGEVKVLASDRLRPTNYDGDYQYVADNRISTE